MWLLPLLVLLLIGFTQGQDNTRLTVSPVLRGDSLMVQVSIRELFQPRLRKALLAGLPIAFSVSAQLQQNGGQVVVKRVANGRVLYDVWEEEFSLRDWWNHSLIFSEFSLLDAWFSSLPPIYLTSLTALKENFEYKVAVQSRFVLLSEKQKQKLKRWLEQSEQTEEELPTQERSTGFKLNLNRLIRLIVSGDEKEEEFIFQAVSAPFRRGDLLKDGQNSH